MCAAAVGEDIDLQQVTAEEARAFYRAQGGFAGANADFLFGFESYEGVEGATDQPQDASVADEVIIWTSAGSRGNVPARTSSGLTITLLTSPGPRPSPAAR